MVTHAVTVRYVKTRGQWEGVCSCGRWSCVAPPAAGEAAIEAQAKLHVPKVRHVADNRQ